MSSKALNLAGKTKLFDLAALISNSKFLISPDSGPIHIATCTNTKVIGLYAVTNTVRAGPYNSIDYCIDKYNLALKLFYKMNHEESDAIFVSCTALRIVEVLQKAEEKIKKTIISSNQSMIWDSIRSININNKISNFGKLLLN